MEFSLSVILPVYNAEKQLAPRIVDLLDMLADLRIAFEVLIVDDGSTDHTVELADELAQRFPQLRVIRLGRRQGLLAACRVGIDRAAAPLLLLYNIDTPVRSTELDGLWQWRADPELVVAQSRPSGRGRRFIARLLGWHEEPSARNAAGADEPASFDGMQLICRDALVEFRADRHASSQVDVIRRKDLADSLARPKLASTRVRDVARKHSDPVD